MAKSAAPTIPDGLTLDPDRDWIKVECEACGADAHVENGAGNTVSQSVTVTATLPDGSEVPVVVDQEVPSPTLRWVCNECGQAQDHELKDSK